MITRTKIAFALIVLAGVGLLDASYLAIEHFRGEIPPCTIEGCETVLASEYATVLGAPVALLGTLYYLSVFLLAMRYLDTQNDRLFRTIAGISIFGLFAAGWFTYLQAAVIGAYCIYCLVSAGTSTLIFIAAQMGVKIHSGSTS